MTRARPDTVLHEDGCPTHHGTKSTAAKEKLGVHYSLRPANSPDLMPIETIWRILKAMVRKVFSQKEKHPHSAKEVFKVMQEY